MLADKPCYYNLNKLNTVETMLLENVEMVGANIGIAEVSLPSLTKVTDSLTIGPNSVQTLSVPSLVSLSQALTVHGQTNMSEISFPSLESLHSLIMYDNNQTLLPGDFGKLSNIYYVYLNGFIDT